MDYRAIFQISASGMDVERLRLETAAFNLANMNTTVPVGGTPFQPMKVVARPVAAAFDAWMHRAQDGSTGGVEASLVPQTVSPRIVHDPHHPDADAKGDVRYPGVDHTQEMLNVVTALRSYEANVAAIAAAKAMATHALEIGGQS